MLYTGKGDDGTTYTFGCNQRFSKDSELSEALGTMDELNSLLGLCKAQIKEKEAIEDVLEVQQNLFIIQAELAGADKKITKKKVENLEEKIDEIEKGLPEIKTFFISGACEESALFDYSRTIARRAERRVVSVKDRVGENTLAYLNRLSSFLYAMARLYAYKSDIKESAPTYE